MAWSGPVKGAAAPFQPSYGVPGQAPYGHPQTSQYGQQPGYSQYQNEFAYSQLFAQPKPPEIRPPKKKGNPIITRYPPPPGYRGPAQPQGPFGTVQYQTPQQGFPQCHPAPDAYPNQSYQGPSPTQGYSPQGYGPPQNHPSQQVFPQPGYAPTQNYQWLQQPPQGYPPQPPIPQPTQFPTVQNYTQQQASYQQHPNQPPPINTNQQAWPNQQGWQPTPVSATFPTTKQYNPFGVHTANAQTISDSNAAPTPSSANPAASLPTPTNTQPPSAIHETASDEKPPLFLGWDDWDFNFDGAIWPKADEPVDPNLSLGIITWRPAKQVTRALPATFEEAEEQSLKPPAEKLGNGESVSLYFTVENSYEAFLDVRKTDEWYKIKDDPAFVVFTQEEMSRNLVSIEDCLALRDRPDEPIEETPGQGDEEMHDSTWNVMDNLEQALSGDTEDVKRPTPPRPAGNRARNEAQEEMLAKLGVTGSPKPPSNEPLSIPFPREDQLPASLPPKPPAPPSASIPPRPQAPPQRAQSYGGHRNSTFGSTTTQRPYGSTSSASSHQSPPVALQGGNTVARSSNAPAQPQYGGGGTDGSPARSETGKPIAAFSDLEAEKSTNGTENGSAPVAGLKRSDSSFARKRSYEDTDQEDGQVRQQDDNTKRKRRPQVDAAYSRR